jgi:hypothetical protein
MHIFSNLSIILTTLLFTLLPTYALPTSSSFAASNATDPSSDSSSLSPFLSNSSDVSANSSDLAPALFNISQLRGGGGRGGGGRVGGGRGAPPAYSPRGSPPPYSRTGAVGGIAVGGLAGGALAFGAFRYPLFLYPGLYGYGYYHNYGESHILYSQGGRKALAVCTRAIESVSVADPSSLFPILCCSYPCRHQLDFSLLGNCRCSPDQYNETVRAQADNSTQLGDDPALRPEGVDAQTACGGNGERTNATECVAAGGSCYCDRDDQVRDEEESAGVRGMMVGTEKGWKVVGLGLVVGVGMLV